MLARGRAGTAPLEGVESPHLSFVHHLAKISFFLFATPLALWLLVSFVLPLVFGLLRKPDLFVDWLRLVQAIEHRQSAWATPELTVGEHCYLEQAWPYRRAHALVTAVIPQDEVGMFIAGNASDRARLENISAGAGTSSSQRPEANPALARVTQLVTTWFGDRFFPIQTAWWTVVLTRTWYALQLLVLALFGCVVAFFIGEFNARTRDAEGFISKGNRFEWCLVTMKYALAIIPGYVALLVSAFIIPVLIL
ncbi:MAG TPA: hypothetical protein VHX44_04460, partial [Planctomycetota bacterium]|nr:hypothetical protein [Planctomycetota bacterium]